MTRVQPLTIDEAQAEVKSLYQDLTKKIGRVPNIFQTMGHSAVVLKTFLGMQEAAKHLSISPKTAEMIALEVAQVNHCNYCLSAHTLMAKGAGIEDKDIMNARHGESDDPKTKSILAFVKRVIENRGNVTNQDVSGLKANGVNDAEIVEIVYLIMMNMFTNYFNHVTDPQIDFPAAPGLN